MEDYSMSRCLQCNLEIIQSASFCTHCGILQKADVSDAIECENHAGENAVGLCVVCGKPVCDDCAVTTDRKIFCENAQHKAVFADWSIVHVSGFEFESDMIQRNLFSAGIESKIFSFRDHVGAFGLPDTQLVRVMVPRQQQQQAVELLRDLHLIDYEESP